MARYLIVAHQTAASPELVERVGALAAADPTAEFGIIVPATPVGHLLHNWDEIEVHEIAKAQARRAEEALAAVGVRVVSARIGDPDPMLAVEDEMRAAPGYTGIVVSTFPPGLSRWLRADLPTKLARRYPIPVEHVVAAHAAAPSG
jgi:nucleotide-binding universal stress UspA family protein